jgi:ABC-type transport system substrate-binding protein
MSVVASDKYTVTFKWAVSNPEYIFEALQAQAGAGQEFEAPEAVKQWSNLDDWHRAIGTGPFILQDFVSDSSATLVKNPNYWGYDERYPKNQLPYIDKLSFLIIPDDATALSAMRTGKIDAIGSTSFVQAQQMKKTNPEILQIPTPAATTTTVDPRNDVIPFKDIKVRKAMQMSIDLPTIAKTYYLGSADPTPSTLTTRYMTGWGWPFEQWPQELKDEYAYNPTAAKKLLADAGYPSGFKTNIVADAAGDMDLLQIVKSYFAAIGIEMDIRTMDTGSWSAFVQISHKHDQMAQRSTSSLGVNYEPLVQLNKFHTGGSSDFAMVSDPVFDGFLTQATAANSISDFKKILRDANEYVARQHFVVSLLQPMTFGLYQPWLKGYNGQDGSVWGTVVPRVLFFYPARFWIDRNLKGSMGH